MIENKVEKSGIVTLDLEKIVPDKSVFFIDIKEQLFQGLILREKDFRLWIKENDWSIYKDGVVGVHCSVDAIVPTWAFMLVTAALDGIASEMYFANEKELNSLRAEKFIGQLDISDYLDKRIVIKGCGDRAISNHAYVSLTNKLLGKVKSLMYGEPCSTVPVYKNRGN